MSVELELTTGEKLTLSDSLEQIDHVIWASEIRHSDHIGGRDDFKFPDGRRVARREIRQYRTLPE